MRAMSSAETVSDVRRCWSTERGQADITGTCTDETCRLTALLPLDGLVALDILDGQPSRKPLNQNYNVRFKEPSTGQICSRRSTDIFDAKRPSVVCIFLGTS